MIRNITVNDAPIIKKKIGMNVDGRMHSEMTAFYRLFVPTAISLPFLTESKMQKWDRWISQKIRKGASTKEAPLYSLLCEL